MNVARDTRPLWAPLAAWTALVACAAVWGRALEAGGAELHLGAPPVAGAVAVRAGLRTLPALALVALLLVAGPAAARGLRWPHLLAAASAAAAAWAVALAFVDGWDALTAPLRSRFDYLADLPAVGEGFLRTFTDRIDRYRTHVAGHPPGIMLLLRAVAPAPGRAAALAIAGGASAVPAVMVAVRALAGERAARDAAPFLAFAPSVLWVATSMDGLYAGVAAWAVAALAVASTSDGPRSTLAATAGGLLLGGGLFLSYGVAPIVAVAFAVLFATGRIRVALVATGAAAVVTLTFAAGGFWWFDGLDATRVRYRDGLGGVRPLGYFLAGNLAAFAVSVGPAAAVAVARLRDRRLWLLTGGALACVAMSNVSGLSKGEAERIWLPFAPWVLAGCAALRGDRRWLGVQAVVALAVQTFVRTPW